MNFYHTWKEFFLREDITTSPEEQETICQHIMDGNDMLQKFERAESETNTLFLAMLESEVDPVWLHSFATVKGSRVVNRNSFVSRG